MLSIFYLKIKVVIIYIFYFKKQSIYYRVSILLVYWERVIRKIEFLFLFGLVVNGEIFNRDINNVLSCEKCFEEG